MRQGTMYYTRDNDGNWWIEYSGDFLNDKSTRVPAPNSKELEEEYQRSIAGALKRRGYKH